MAKKNTPPPRRDSRARELAADPAAPHGRQFVVFRETVESIAVAFVLAFLFRTFEAEAFVIPTGSMAPSLMGQHKDVDCPQCGFSFRTTASSEGEERDRLLALLTNARGLDVADIREQIANLDVVGGMCPMCRYLMPMRPDLPVNVLANADFSPTEIEYQSYPGDRILVNKYGFDFDDPERWDVIVFKFPGDGNMNYIKRLTGLPGETLRVYLGDVFTKPREGAEDEFAIERKPPDKVAAMLTLVHDTDYESATLRKAGWPLRWAATTADGWQVVAKPGKQTVAQRFEVDLTKAAPLAWLRYRHQVPTVDDWQVARSVARTGSFEEMSREGYTQEEWLAAIHPQLITDFNAYNARLVREHAANHGWRIRSNSGRNSGSLGTEWVGDLALDCEVDVAEARGELVLDLVEAGYHFRATIDLKSGMAELSIVDGRNGQTLDKFKAAGDTGIDGAGEYRLRFANVDDQLHLWVDGELIDCGDSRYDPDALFGGRESMIPWASEDDQGDQGDLTPTGVAARGAKLAVTRLAVLRDIYYIATKYPGDMQHIADYELPHSDFTLDGTRYPALENEEQLFAVKSAWQRFATREPRDFEIEKNQLFVMGDNSPESKDCRLWMAGDRITGIPGGRYLDRRLLIGKAICVFWPHSWGSIPGLPILPGWPNFGDMRMVR